MEKNVAGPRDRALDRYDPIRSGVQFMRKNLRGIIQCNATNNGAGRRVRRGQFVVKENRLAL
jgi:hypothetical protein